MSVPESEPDDALIAHLEPNQLTAATRQPLPRAVLSQRAQVGLWVLRIFSIILGVMVVYTFVSQL
jgi:hypothetical protein